MLYIDWSFPEDWIKKVFQMIQVTRLNGTHYYLNCERIQTVEATPDTVITLIDGVRLVVKESPEQVAGRVIDYKQKIFTGLYTNRAGEGS